MRSFGRVTAAAAAATTARNNNRAVNELLYRQRPLSSAHRARALSFDVSGARVLPPRKTKNITRLYIGTYKNVFSRCFWTVLAAFDDYVNSAYDID